MEGISDLKEVETVLAEKARLNKIKLPRGLKMISISLPPLNYPFKNAFIKATSSASWEEAVIEIHTSDPNIM